MIQQKFEQALSLHQKGQLDQAQNIYLKILEDQPKHQDSLYFLGVIACQKKNYQQGVDFIKEAISINPHSDFFYSNLCMALVELGQLEEAVLNYDKAIDLNSKNADYYYNRATILQNLGRFELALASYDKAIELNSSDADYYYNRGMVLYGLKDLKQALINYDKAIQLRPNSSEFYINRGNVLLDLKKADLAAVSYNMALQLGANCAELYYNFGNSLFELKQFKLAIDNYDKAISLKSDYAPAYHNRGNALAGMSQFDLAVASYEKVAELSNNGYKLLPAIIFHTKTKICDWDNDYEKNKTDIENRIKNNEAVSMPFQILPIIDSPEIHYLTAKISVEQNYLAKENCSIAKRPRNNKIRIGYYSADFHRHATSYLMAGLFESHDKSKFEIIAFSFGPNKDDEMRSRISASFDQFIDFRLKSDDEIVALSRELEIDIAIDLKGFTQDMRIGIFAKRCAPIQVNYLGYPGTMAAPYIDYIIADKMLIPEESQKHYLEKIVYLPNSYQVNDSKRQISNTIFTKKELGLPEEGFIYCCFNNIYKITPDTFDGWARILKATESQNSVLWLLDDNPSATQNLQKEIQKRGIDSSRLIFAKRVLSEDHLARHKCADLFIDTLPCNAHTTCSDSLWAGLPLLTLAGKSFAARVAASLLNAIKLPELITATQEEYEKTAIELAKNPDKLRALKGKLEQNRFTTPLFNTKLFTTNIEEAYKAMYERYCSDLSPSNIEIEDQK